LLLVASACASTCSATSVAVHRLADLHSCVLGFVDGFA
jgi:hypothetical protein